MINMLKLTSSILYIFVGSISATLAWTLLSPVMSTYVASAFSLFCAIGVVAVVAREAYRIDFAVVYSGVHTLLTLTQINMSTVFGEFMLRPVLIFAGYMCLYSTCKMVEKMYKEKEDSKSISASVNVGNLALCITLISQMQDKVNTNNPPAAKKYLSELIDEVVLSKNVTNNTKYIIVKRSISMLDLRWSIDVLDETKKAWTKELSEIKTILVKEVGKGDM